DTIHAVFRRKTSLLIQGDGLSSLLDDGPPVEERGKTGDRDELSERGGRQLRTRLGAMNEMGDAKFFCRNQAALIIIHIERPCRIESQQSLATRPVLRTHFQIPDFK